MHELEVTRHIGQHKSKACLELVCWDDETGKIHTVWVVSEVFWSERRLCGGGRFRRRNPTLARMNTVAIRIDHQPIYNSLPHFARPRPFEICLEWLGSNMEREWNFDIIPDPPIEYNHGFAQTTMTVMSATILFSFSDAGDAILFKLKNT